MRSDHISSIESRSGANATDAPMQGAIESLIASALGVCTDDVDCNARLWDDFGVDRVELLELASEIEATLEIEIGTEPLQRLVVVQDFVDCVIAAALVPPVVHAGTNRRFERWFGATQLPPAIAGR